MLTDEIFFTCFWYLYGTFCLWVRAQSNDFSTESLA